MPPKARAIDIDIGARLRAARTDRRLSQRELARKSGVTNGLISQIEQNHSSPSVSSLKRILDAIPLSLAEFFRPSDEESKVFFRAADLTPLSPARLFGLTADEAARITITQAGHGGKLRLSREYFGPGADTAEQIDQDGELAGFIIEGAIEITVGAESMVLVQGDAYRFDGSLPHRFRNASSDPCVIIAASTPEKGI